jgi:hypothetical protein
LSTGAIDTGAPADCRGLGYFFFVRDFALGATGGNAKTLSKVEGLSCTTQKASS